MAGAGFLTGFVWHGWLHGELVKLTTGVSIDHFRRYLLQAPTEPLPVLIFLALALPSDLTNEGDLCNEVNTRSFVSPPDKPLPSQVTFPPPHNLG